MKYILLLLFLSAGIVNAEIYKCTGEDGKTSFQKSPCAYLDNAKPLDLKQPSPLRLLKIQHEARLRDIDNKHRRDTEEKRVFEEEKHQAELNAINARENAWNQINYDSQRAREQAEQNQADWELRQRCLRKVVISASDECAIHIRP